MWELGIGNWALGIGGDEGDGNAKGQRARGKGEGAKGKGKIPPCPVLQSLDQRRPLLQLCAFSLFPFPYPKGFALCPLVIISNFAMTNGCQCIGFGNTTVLDGAVYNPVVAALHTALDFTFHVC